MGYCKICSGCTAFWVACLAILAGLFHSGNLPIVANVIGRFSDGHGNLPLSGMSPAAFGDRSWRYEYSMLPDLSGRVALVTGANTGLGFWTALHLARQGAHVFVGCRSESKCIKAVDMIKANHTSAKVDIAIVDVGNMASVRAFGDQFLKKVDRLDILVLNAGITTSIESRSVDGLDPVFATNHVGSQLLYTLLEDLVLATGEKTGDGRVVVVSSAEHFFSYDDGVALTRAELNARWDRCMADPLNRDTCNAYSQSKLAGVLFAQEVARRMNCKPVFANSVHPGAVLTEIWDKSYAVMTEHGADTRWSRKITDYFSESMWRAEEGALTQVYLAAAADVKERELRGRYFHPQAVETLPCARFAHDLKLQKDLWAFTEQLIEGRG